MDISQLRADNLRQLINSQFGGNQTKFAVTFGKSVTQMNQYINGYRNMGEKTARSIESVLGLPHGWMDVENNGQLDAKNIDTNDGFTLTNQARSHHDEDTVPPTHIKIKDSNIRFAAGNGCEYITEDDNDGGYALYRLEWLEENGFNPDDLIRGINHGHSMANFIKDHARILIHTKDTQIDNDPESVYALCFDNALKVKYIQKHEDGIVLVSENKDFPDEHITAAMCNEYVQIIGRVVEVTNPTKQRVQKQSRQRR